LEKSIDTTQPRCHAYREEHSDSVVGTLLGINDRTKDGINARADLELMNIRKKQHPRREGSRTFLPPALYFMSKDEKTLFLECLLICVLLMGIVQICLVV
jgi:hypothetical protein